ncbi:MAG: DUF488 domain-containing protein [Burkholderiales bacterium]|nr:DUF488 domain-containing protein [Rhodospirillales bacterium]MCP5246897.1 DUF488 domain-containing protein [Burkholderiales bacterium]
MMNKHVIKIFTIGFTGSSAEHFFERLKRAGVKKVIDTRLWASSQLAGFAKKKDLPYFLEELVSADYEYRQELAPSDKILKAYKNNSISWDDYEVQYIDLINHRNIAHILSPNEVHEACFLCACKTEHHCHRRLLAEYLQNQWNTPLEIIHL